MRLNSLYAARINDFRFHDLRHTFASHLVMAGVDLVTVKDLLGHAGINMTVRYSHLVPEHKAQSRRQVGREIQGGRAGSAAARRSRVTGTQGSNRCGFDSEVGTKPERFFWCEEVAD
jgi:Phage integrase family